MTKEQVLQRLTKTLVAAKREDVRVVAKHHKQEQAALAKYRTSLRKALTWDWKKAKDRGFQVDFSRYHDTPRCPNRVAPAFAHMIECVRLDKLNKTYKVQEGSDLYQAVFWRPGRKISQTV